MSGMSLRKMAHVSLKEGELGVALGNGRPLASIRVQILVKTTVNDKRQKARIPATKLQWLPARHAILTSGSGRTLDGRESLRAGRDAQLLPCRPAVRYPGPNAHTGPDGRTSVNQPSAAALAVIGSNGKLFAPFLCPTSHCGWVVHVQPNSPRFQERICVLPTHTCFLSQ